MSTTYTTEGSVRGSCGHKHKTLESAIKCLQVDRDGCGAQGAYSDRQVVRTGGEPMTEREHDEMGEIYERLDS